MTRYTRDKHPLSHGSVADRLTGKYGPYSLASAIECVVDKAYYPDDAANTSKKYMEYSVVVLTTKTIIPTVRQLVAGGGFANGDYVVLQETTGTVNNPNDPTFDRKKTDSSKWNGDRVLVGFVGGNQNAPVIVGVLPHPSTGYGGKRNDGRVRKLVWNKAVATIDKDGNVSVTTPNTSLTIDNTNKKTTVDIGGNATLTVDGNNKKTTINVGGGAATRDTAPRCTPKRGRSPAGSAPGWPGRPCAPAAPGGS